MSFAKLRFCQLARASVVPYLKNYQAYIGGKWKAAADNSTFPVYNPATGAKLADVSDVGKDDVEEAVFEASRAFQSWKAKTAKVILCFLYFSSHCKFFQYVHLLPTYAFLCMLMVFLKDNTVA